jgi:hypothetical protein
MEPDIKEEVGSMTIPKPDTQTAPIELDKARQAEEKFSGFEVTQKRLARIIPEVRSGQWILNSINVLDVQKHSQRQILTCQLSYTEIPARRQHSISLVCKVDRKNSRQSEQAYNVLKCLWEAGFQPPSEFCVPRPFACCPEQGILLQSQAPGIMWADFLHAGGIRLERASGLVADWLAQLQISGVKASLREAEDYSALTLRNASRLKALFPGYAGRIEKIEARLLRDLPAPRLALVPSHGDFHPKNVFLELPRVTVIDFDTFGAREAAYDVGYGIALLYIMSFFRTGSFGAGERAGAAFWEAYRLSGKATWPRVVLQVARALLDNLHYTFYLMKNSRVELLPLWLDLVEAWLAASSPVVFEKYTGSFSHLIPFKPSKNLAKVIDLDLDYVKWEREA